MRHFRSVFRNVLVFTVTCLSTVFFPRVDGGRGEVRLQVPAMRAAAAREAGGSPCSHAAPRACGGSVALARARSRRRVSCRVVAAAGTQGKRARRLRARARPERRAGPGCWRPAGRSALCCRHRTPASGLTLSRRVALLLDACGRRRDRPRKVSRSSSSNPRLGYRPRREGLCGCDSAVLRWAGDPAGSRVPTRCF